MEFLIEFDVRVPSGTPEHEVKERESAEARATAGLAEQGHLKRVWRMAGADGENRILGLYSADSRAELDGLLDALPLRDWMEIGVTALEPHPNDPAVAGS
jgi:muconolactone D-isomerase